MSESFWQGKTPCWEMHACPPDVRRECPAPHHPEYACWTLGGTPCKVNLVAGMDEDTSICYNCNVYMRYGGGQEIEIALPSEGMAHSRLLLEIAHASGFCEQRMARMRGRQDEQCHG
ncbi:MAG: hypothetical protein ONB25_13105 [candidate division KSB1 bacterium]|nr:hypothetical protein [candidate division KSB1 bacterium]